MPRSISRFRVGSIILLVMLIIVVVAGAVVRITGSGLGCADWPQCSDERFVDMSSTHTLIEQINRLYSAVVGFVAFGVWVAAWRLRKLRRDLLFWATLTVIGVGLNAVVGGLSVRFALHPLAIQSHLLLALMCVVTATVMVKRAGSPNRPTVRRAVTRPTWRLVVGLAILTSAVIIAGTVVTGAGPHAGDETAQRLAVAVPTVARIHGGIVSLALVVALGLAWRLRSHRVDQRLLEPLSTWIFIGLLQAAVGYVQYFSGVPAVLVAVHVAGATTVVWATTRLVLATEAS